MDTRAALLAHLESDFDLHLITLKFLTMFGDRCQIRLETDPQGWASLVWFAAGLFAWDRQTYPNAKSVVFLDGTSIPLLAALTEQLPPGPLVVKSSDPRALAYLEQQGWSPARSFLWYSGSPLPGDTSGVREVVGPEPEFDELLAGNGYQSAERASLWNRAARGYVAEGLTGVRAFCLVYPNYGPVWEIASVKTFEAYRRQGWGTRVVRAAAHSVVTREQRIRYHVDAENLASRYLAESIGLRELVEARHYATGG